MNLKKYFILKGLSLLELAIVGIIIIILLIMFIPNRKGAQMQNYSRKFNAEISNVKCQAKGVYYKIVGTPTYEPSNGTYCTGEPYRIKQ